MPLTRREAFVITAFTGISTTNFGEFQGFAEKILGRPIWTPRVRIAGCLGRPQRSDQGRVPGHLQGRS